MAKEWAISFYNSKAWKDCRSSYISSVFGLCERCESTGYIVHHKEHLTPNNINNPNISLNHDNLEYLCKRCHDEEHDIAVTGCVTRDGFKFNLYGELVRDDGDSS